jgi:hypothetical protein
MANKTKDAKNYISSIGKTEQLHVFVGTTNSTITDNSSDSAKQLWKDTVFTKKISKNDVIGVVPTIEWKSGNAYVPWNSGGSNSGAYYAWNKSNGIVYLCVQNNDFARADFSNKIASTFAPTHEYGIQRYSDGYSWLPIYRITSDYLRFVKNNWIPVISFEDFEEETFTSQYLAADSFCDNNFGATGYCGLYFKQNIEIPTSGISYDNYVKGELYTSFSSECSECYFLFKDNNEFESKFFTSQSAVESSIIVYDKFEKIESLINQNLIAPSSAFYALYTIAQNGPDDGAVISATIDLSGLSGANLVATEANPELIISSFTGTGATIRFKTITSISGTQLINGIEVVSNGSGYRDITLDFDENKLENTSIKDLLLSTISVNLDVIDGLNIDPYDVLDVKNIMVDARIDTGEIDQQSITLPESINFYGLVSNPLEETDTGDFVVSGSKLSPYTSEVKTAISKIRIINEFTIPEDPPTLTPVPGQSAPKDSSGSSVASTNVLAVGDYEVYEYTNPEGDIETYNTSVLDVIGLDYANLADMTTFTDADDNTFDVINIDDQPVFKQYSGKVLQTKKTTTNIPLKSNSGELSRIIRINIIKGV